MKQTDPGYRSNRRREVTRLLAETLARAQPTLAKSLRRQIVGLTNHWLMMQDRNEVVIHPGAALMAKWVGGCEKTARRNMTTIKNWGVAEAVQYAKGGRHATRYVLCMTTLFRTLMTMGCNPSPELQAALCGNPDVDAYKINKIHELARQNVHVFSTGNAKAGGAASERPKRGHSEGQKPGQKPRHMSTGIHLNTQAAVQGLTGDVETGCQRADATDAAMVAKIAGDNAESVETGSPSLPTERPRLSSEIDLSDDARAMLEYLAAVGPRTYGAAATGLGWGATRAFQVQDAIVAAGLAQMDHTGRVRAA